MGRLFRRNCALQGQKGLTLIELLVVVGIIAIMLGISIPYISVQDAELRSTARSLRAHLMQARMEALKKYTCVTFSANSTYYDATYYNFKTGKNYVLFEKHLPKIFNININSNYKIYFKPSGNLNANSCVSPTMTSIKAIDIYSKTGSSWSINASVSGMIEIEKKDE